MNKFIAPIHLQQELTDSCNHHCKHCYNYWRTDSWKNGRVDEAKILDIADKIIDSDVFHVTITGGEPLLVPIDTLDKLIRKYKDANVEVSMNSNITLIRPEHIQLLKKYNVRVLTSIISSNEEDFDNTTMVKGAYNRFIDSMNLLRDNNISVACNMVVTKSNLNDVYSTGKLAYSLGSKSFCATKVCKSDNGVIPNYDNTCLESFEIESMFDQLLRVKEDLKINIGTLNPVPPCAVDNPSKYMDLLNRSCTAGSSTVNVASNGDVKACLHVDISYGNVLMTSLKELWKNIPVWKDEFLKNNTACDTCAEKSFCSGGCRGDGYVDNKSLYDKDPSMREPLTEKVYINKPLNKISAIKIVGGIKARPEEKGAVLYKNMFSQLYIDGFSYDLILRNFGTNINREDLIKSGVNKEYVDKLFNNLVNKELAEAQQ